MKTTKAKINHTRVRKLREGEFISRTQTSIKNIDTQALEIRVQGISATREALQRVPYGDAPNEEVFDVFRDVARNIIASMNYSVQDCVKELKLRKISK
jgi:hypothetical protein